MSLLLAGRYKNLCAILEDLTAKDIRYKLVNGVFRVDAKAANLTPDLIEAIDVCREGLGMAVARQHRLCLVCKRNRAVRPETLSWTREGRDWCEHCWQKQTDIPLMQTVKPPHPRGVWLLNL